MHTSPPQFCSHFYERCAMCWIELKINFTIFPIFIFRVIVKFNWKLTVLNTKMTITRKIYILNIFFYRFRTLKPWAYSQDDGWIALAIPAWMDGPTHKMTGVGYWLYQRGWMGLLTRCNPRNFFRRECKNVMIPASIQVFCSIRYIFAV